MVFRLPGEQSLRTSINYIQLIGLSIVWNLFLLLLFVSFLFALFLVIKWKYTKGEEQLKISDKVGMELELAEVTPHDLESQKVDEGKNLFDKKVASYTKIIKIVDISRSILFYTFWILIVLSYLTLYMLKFFGRGTLVDIVSIIFMTSSSAIPTIIWQKYNHNSNNGRNNQKKSKKSRIILVIVCTVVSIILVGITKGTCICFFTDKYGIQVNKQVTFSTDFSRMVSLQQVCKDNQLCHLYATLPTDSSTSVFLNAHTGLALDHITFTMRTDQSSIEKVSSKPFKMDNVDFVGKRYVHSVLVNNLIPDTLYSLEIKSKNGTILKKTNYKTLPGLNADSIRIAAGGDLGMTSAGQQLTNNLKNFNPDVIVLGGDTVYGHALRTCYYNWDIFYWMFEAVNNHLDRLVPLTLSVGNHDVGFDSLNTAGIPLNNEDLHLFFLYNLQN